VGVGGGLGHGGQPGPEKHRDHRRGERRVRPVVEVPADPLSPVAHASRTVRRRGCLRRPPCATIRVMPGHLALKQLDQLIRKGEVDTVLTVFPDGFGRLMGKRVVGSYFLDHVVDEGAHACIYLFTVDMEMEPLPGFKLTSWERGYGD